MAENTFLGLQPYTEADAYRFKGRTEESQELFRLIVRNNYTVCYAESGEGKTSLLNAGVFPLLRQNMYFPIAITFTSDDYEHTPDSFDTIIDRCIRDSITEYNETNKGIHVEYKLYSTDFQDLNCQADLQQEVSQYSWWKLRNYRPQAMGLTFTPVFVFDQFEEVFNLPGSIVWTKKFFDWLEEVSSDSCPDDIIEKIRSIIGEEAAFPTIKEEKDFKAIFSLRKEFIGELDYWGMQKCFIPSLKDNRYCLKALTYEGAKKVMTQQQRFEEEKVEQVLRYFVQQYSREPEKTIAENLPVIPALLLSVVCDSWEKDIDFFSGKNENEIGQSLNKILERFYDEALSTITNKLQEGNSQAESIRKDIETAIFALVDSNGKRVRRKSSELSHLDFDAKYKEILSRKRIVKISKVDGEDYVEIVHDALCPIIAKRKELYLAAEAKKREEEKLREQANKMRKRMMVVSILSLLVIGIAAWIIHEMKQRESNMLINQSRFIAEKASQLVDEGDSYMAQRLLLEVIDKPSMPYTAEAEIALRKACLQNSVILYGHSSTVCSSSFSPDGKKIVSASWDNTIRIWDAETGKELRTVKGHTNVVNSANFSPDGKYIVSASNDNTIRIWDAETGKELKTLEGHQYGVKSASFSPDCTRIVTASEDETIKIWNAETGEELSTLVGHEGIVNTASFSSDGKKIVSASSDKTVRIWDVESGKEIMTLVGHILNIPTASFSPDGKRIVSASFDRTIRIWDAETGKELRTIKGHRAIVYSASFSADGKRIVSASNDKTIRIWDGKYGDELIFLAGHKGSVKSAFFSPDGKKIISASSDKTVRIWDIETEKEPMNLEGHIAYIYSVAFSPDGKKIASASQDETVRIWDAETGKELLVMVGGSIRNIVFSSAFSPNGKRIISASGDDNTIRICNTETGIITLLEHTGPVYFATFNSNGKKIVSASRDTTIRIWDAETGKELRTVKGHTDRVNSANFSPDGKRIVSASNDETIRIWDAETGKELRTVKGHTDRVNSANFSLDGKRIVSASDDKTIRIWDAETGKELRTFEGHTSCVNSASFSPDGKRIVSASSGTIKIWDFPPLQELIDSVRERFKDYPLTPEERKKYYLE